MANWRVTTTSGPEIIDADLLIQEEAALVCAKADGETVAVFARGSWVSAVKFE